MKKLFTFLFAALMSVSMFADDYLYFSEIMGQNGTIMYGEVPAGQPYYDDVNTTWYNNGYGSTELNEFKQNICKVIYFDASCQNFAKENIYSLFGGFFVLEEIKNPENLNTASVKQMYAVFANCQALTALDLSSWNTSKVTDMSSMFFNCYALASLNLSGWDVSEVTSMKSMFCNCKALTALDLSGWNTSKLTNMQTMFCNCEALTSLKLIKWDTSKVTKMGAMFEGCKNLEHIYVTSGWTTAAVTADADHQHMFGGCVKLPNFDANYTDKTKAHTDEGGYLELVLTLQLVADPEKGSVEVTNLLGSDIIDNGNGNYTVPANAEVTILATPLEGYEFSGWKTGNIDEMVGCYYCGTAVNTEDNPYTFTMTEDIAYLAEFEAKSEGIENVQSDKVQSTKILRDGQLLIEKNGKTYNATGAQVR